VPEFITIIAEDGVVLEGELTMALTPRFGLVLCHPHPLHGGTMQSIVVGALFRTVPKYNVAALRFNFRGVGNSDGEHDGGPAEQLDAIAAVKLLAVKLPPGTPIVLAGWSFGAEVALSVLDPAIAAWIGIAPPLRFADVDGMERDPRPKLVLLAEHDEIRPASEVADATITWPNTTVEIVPGASHYFVGRTDWLVRSVVEFLDGLPAPQ
jgi:alpha/beta superfamily hydrolase